MISEFARSLRSLAKYLYAQSGFIFDPKDEDLNEKIDDIDEGFMDGEHELEMTNDYSEDMTTVACPTVMDSDDDEVRTIMILLAIMILNPTYM